MRKLRCRSCLEWVTRSIIRSSEVYHADTVEYRTGLLLVRHTDVYQEGSACYITLGVQEDCHGEQYDFSNWGFYTSDT